MLTRLTAPGPHLEVPGPPRVSPFASIRQPTFAIAATVEPDAYFGSDNTICFGDITTKKIKHEYDTSWILRNAKALFNLILKENEIKTQELIFQGSQLVNRVGASDSAGRQHRACREVSLLASTDTGSSENGPMRGALGCWRSQQAIASSSPRLAIARSPRLKHCVRIRKRRI